MNGLASLRKLSALVQRLERCAAALEIVIGADFNGTRRMFIIGGRVWTIDSISLAFSLSHELNKCGLRCSIWLTSDVSYKVGYKGVKDRHLFVVERCASYHAWRRAAVFVSVIGTQAALVLDDRSCMFPGPTLSKGYACIHRIHEIVISLEALRGKGLDGAWCTEDFTHSAEGSIVSLLQKYLSKLRCFHGRRVDASTCHTGDVVRVRRRNEVQDRVLIMLALLNEISDVFSAVLSVVDCVVGADGAFGLMDGSSMTLDFFGQNDAHVAQSIEVCAVTIEEVFAADGDVAG